MQKKRVQDLEDDLSVAEAKIREIFKAGKIPGPEDYAEVDLIKKELKAARRVKAMEEKRTGIDAHGIMAGKIFRMWSAS